MIKLLSTFLPNLGIDFDVFVKNCPSTLSNSVNSKIMMINIVDMNINDNRIDDANDRCNEKLLINISIFYSCHKSLNQIFDEKEMKNI